jgi:hypothetical protein
MRGFLSALLALAAAGLAPGQAVPRPAPPAPPPPLPAVGEASSAAYASSGMTARQKAYQCQLVAAGTVAMGKDTLDAAPYPGWRGAKTTYKVATLSAGEVLLGDKPDGAIKVLIPPADPAQLPFEQPGRPQQYYRPPVSQVQLIDGQEGVFFLAPHPTAAGYYHIPYAQTPLNPLDTNYQADLAAVKKVGAALADPAKALKAKDAADRLEAAAALVLTYRRLPPGPAGKLPREAAIPAEESKLILKALAEADWAQYDKPRLGSDPSPDGTLVPSSLLAQLGVYPGQYGMPPFQVPAGRGYNEAFQEHYKTWLDGPGAKFEIRKFVAEKK